MRDERLGDTILHFSRANVFRHGAGVGSGDVDRDLASVLVYRTAGFIERNFCQDEIWTVGEIHHINCHKRLLPLAQRRDQNRPNLLSNGCCSLFPTLLRNGSLEVIQEQNIPSRGRRGRWMLHP